MNKKKISFILSVYNEEKNLQKLYSDLKKSLSEVDVNYELIYINDGSKDQSLNELEIIQRNDKNVKIINFTRNFGHEIAMKAGISHSNGDAVLIMDTDGQNPVNVAIQMIKEFLENNYEIILTKRKNYKESFIKKFSSNVFYKILNFLSDIKFDRSFPDFRLISRKYVDRIEEINESEIMFRGILNWIGFTKYKIIEFEVPERLNGRSSYNLYKYFNLGISGILQFSVKPLRIFTVISVFVCITSIIYAMVVFVDHMINSHPQNGFATIIIVMILIFSIQTCFIALIGEYVGRIHLEVKKRPLYFADIIEGKNKDECN